MHWNSTKWVSIHLQAEQIAATDWNDCVNTNLSVKLGKHRNSVPNCQSIWQKQVWQLKSQIGKLFTIREGIKKIKRCQEICKQSAMFGQTCFETFASLPSMDEWNENWCGLLWLQDDLCDHLKHTVMRKRGKIDSSKNPNNKWYVFLKKVTFCVHSF